MRIEGTKLGDAEVEKLLSGLRSESFASRDKQESVQAPLFPRLSWTRRYTMDMHEWPHFVNNNMFGYDLTPRLKAGNLLSDEPGINIRGEFGFVWKTIYSSQNQARSCSLRKACLLKIPSVEWNRKGRS